MPSDEPLTPLAAITRRRFLLTGWPWRALAYLLTTPPVVLAAALPFSGLVAPWIVLMVWAGDGSYPQPLGTVLFLVVLGAILVVGLGPLLAVPLAALERQRIRLVIPGRAITAHRHPPAAGLWPRLRTRYTEAATWKALAYASLLIVVAPAAYVLAAVFVLLILIMLASPLLVSEGQPVALGLSQLTSAPQAVPYAIAGLALLPTIPYVFAILAGLHAVIARALLLADDPDNLRAQLVDVARSRARLVDAFEAERRRIERDLHDGAQSLLLNLTLQLGMARLDLPTGSPASASVAHAHEQAKQLMTELRQLIRGIHPRVLTDRGLPAALRELTEDVAIPVTVTADIPRRPPSHAEIAAYFVVVEALNNVTKHADATEVAVTARIQGDALTVEVVDDGHGGADPGRGSGLTGLADRVAVIDGRMLLSSPPGGPTIVRVELPCSQN
ncbi:sensor histidine kinase [Rhodococcus sp. W8901]|uniref:sensor histidine kinase n=1 Tax=Rhodococcus sp. W8901 TaxID=2742603 RepID=UPI001581D5FB|nr:sensor histidine kinase [Rhodococcus sp. W8901]QKT12008.1 sensor domain-containing protein [Rhodococcus sp. W8901]